MNENPSLFGNAQLQIDLKTLAAVEAGTMREPPAPYKTPKGSNQNADGQNVTKRWGLTALLPIC